MRGAPMMNPIDILLSIPGIVIYNIANQEFCADIRQVYKILKISETDSASSQTSGSSQYICINDIKIPIIDLHKFFGLKKPKRTTDTRVLFVEVNNTIYGFVVEKIQEFMAITKKFNIEDISTVKQKYSFFLRAVLDYEGRKISLPDFQKIDKAIHTMPENKLENQRAI